MKTFLFRTLLILLLLQKVCVGDWHFYWDTAGKTWKEKWDNTLDSIDKFSVEEKMDILGKSAMLGFYGMPVGDKEEIFKRGRSMMLAIPDHAKYYQDRIEKTRELVKEHARLPEEERSRLDDKKMLLHGGHYDQLRMEAFQILACLPSPEAVAVLGHFLEDPEGRDRKDLLGNPLDTDSDGLPMPPNCRMAYDGISHLGIESPPTGPSDRMGASYPNLDPIDAWKSWWHEVKTGKRTYRFAGSDIEYGPDGPVADVQTQKNVKDRPSNEMRTASERKGSQTTATDPQPAPKAPTIAMVIAAVAVMVSLIWHFGKRRSR